MLLVKALKIKSTNRESLSTDYRDTQSNELCWVSLIRFFITVGILGLI